MKQRACIAIAISLRPKVIIADERPARSMSSCRPGDGHLWPRVQAGARRQRLILIGHDMGLMAQFVDRLA